MCNCKVHQSGSEKKNAQVQHRYLKNVIRYSNKLFVLCYGPHLAVYDVEIKLRMDSLLRHQWMFHHFLDVVYYLHFSCLFFISNVLFFCCVFNGTLPPLLPLYTMPPTALLFFNRHPEPLTDVAVLCLFGAALIVQQMSDNLAS